MACCTPYVPHVHDRADAYLWWAPLGDWIRDATTIGSIRELWAATHATVRGVVQTFLAFAAVFWRNPALFGFYFFLGLVGTLPALTVTFLLKDTFRLEPETMTIWGTLIALPWSIKLVFAFASDRWLFCGYRRRGYIGLGGVLATLGMLCAAMNVLRRSVLKPAAINDSVLHLGSFPAFTACIAIANFGTAWADACTNGALMDYIVATGDAEGVQSVKVATQSAGTLLGVVVGSVAVAAVPAGATLVVVSVCMAAMVCSGLFIPEHTRDAAEPCRERTEQTPTTKSCVAHLRDVWALLVQPRVARVLVFLAAVTLPPDSGTAMFYFLTESLHLSRAFISVISVVSALCGILGSFLYFAKLQTLSFRTLFTGVLLACAVLGYLQIALVTRLNQLIGIPDKVFVLGDDTLEAITVSVIHTPILVIISRVCPPHLEGTAYELVNSVANLCAILSSFLSASLMDALSISRNEFGNLAFLLVLTNSLGLIPLALTWCLPSGSHDRDGQTQTQPLSDTCLGILLSASLAHPHDLLEAIHQHQLASNRGGWTVSGVQAAIAPAATSNPYFNHMLPGKYVPVSLLPVLPGDAIANDGRHDDYRYAASSAPNASEFNSMRSAMRGKRLRDGHNRDRQRNGRSGDTNWLGGHILDPV